jgi:hypothetical protein
MTDESDAGKGIPKTKRDLLHERPEIAAITLTLVAAVLVVASVEAGVSAGLPSAAFGWKLGIEIVRAAVAFAIVAVVVIVLVRGWGGHWPQRISTTSIDWGELADAIEDRRQAGDTVEEVAAQLQALNEALVASRKGTT